MMTDEARIEQLEREAIASDRESGLVRAALAYAEISWAVFPITRAKTPLAGSHGYRDASLDRRRIRELFASPDARGVAIATEASKLVVVDVDPRNGGTETAARVLVGELPPCPINRTPRGGLHDVFRAPVLSKIMTKAHALGPGIDVEASGQGVIFVPPTPAYSWEVSPFQMPPPHLPFWLWQLLPKAEPPWRQNRPRGPRSLPFSTADALEILGRLGRVKKSSSGWLTLCPAHADRHNSLSVCEGSDRLPLFHCFAGCAFGEILAAIQSLRGAA